MLNSGTFSQNPIKRNSKKVSYQKKLCHFLGSGCVNEYCWPNVKSEFPFPVQSPCDVDTSRAVPIDLPPIVIHLLWYMPEETVKIMNTGYYRKFITFQLYDIHPCTGIGISTFLLGNIHL